jgi:tetratricopeptide (TPR) repeat protein
MNYQAFDFSQVLVYIAVLNLLVVPALTTDYDAEMTKIYRTHNPDKLGAIPDLLNKYIGREEELLATIREKYNIDETETTSSTPVQQLLTISSRGRHTGSSWPSAEERDLHDTLHNKARIFRSRKLLVEAAHYYEKAIAVDGNDPSSHQELGSIKFGQGREAAAFVLLERAVALEPENSRAHREIASALKESGRATKAAYHTERAVAHEQRMTRAYELARLGNTTGSLWNFGMGCDQWICVHGIHGLH